MRPSRSMHPLKRWSHSKKTREERWTRYYAWWGQKQTSQEGPYTTQTSVWAFLCKIHTIRVQTSKMAKSMAHGDSRLSNRCHREHHDPYRTAEETNVKEQCSDRRSPKISWKTHPIRHHSRSSPVVFPGKLYFLEDGIIVVKAYDQIFARPDLQDIWFTLALSNSPSRADPVYF